MINREPPTGQCIQAATGVTLSQPEIASLCARAARGVGLTWGEAEEYGFAAGYLAQIGQDWSNAVLERFHGEHGGGVKPAVDRWASDIPMCAVTAGIALADFAALPEGIGQDGLTLENVLTPLLILPFAARCARTTGANYAMTIDQLPWATICADGRSHFRRKITPKMAHTLEIAPFSVCRVAPETPQPAPPISTATYAQLDALAMRMTVPATALSQARAGGDGPDID